MAVTLDLMEYPNDWEAQAAYPTNGHHVITFVNTAQLDTAQKKFGPSSLYVDGNSDTITIPDSSDFSIFASNTQTWTIRFFVKHVDHLGDEMYIIQLEGVNDYWYCYNAHGSMLRVAIVTAGTLRINMQAPEIVDTNWHCLTIVKIGQVWGLYNGTAQVAYGTSAVEKDFAGILILGKHPLSEDWYYHGWYDDVLFEKANPFGANPVIGLTDTIAAPTAPHRINTATKLMLHLDGLNGAQATIDSSRCEAHSESVTKQEGTYSLGVFADTDALNDTLIRTIAPTIDLSGYDRILFYIRSSRTGPNLKVSIHDAGGVWTEITPNIASANIWQQVLWDISGVADANKDAIDRIKITIVNAGSDNTFYLDWMAGVTLYTLTLEEKLGLLESLPTLERGLTVSESLAILESETVAISSLLTENLALLESLPTLARALTITESLALLEDLTQYDRGLPLEESLALKEEETVAISALLTESLALKEEETADISALLTESLALKEQLTEFGLSLHESLALKEDLPEILKALLLEESLGLLESLPTLERALTLDESLALLEALTEEERALTLEESLALLEEAHAETLLFRVDKDGNVTYMGTLDGGAFS